MSHNFSSQTISVGDFVLPMNRRTSELEIDTFNRE